MNKIVILIIVIFLGLIIAGVVYLDSGTRSVNKISNEINLPKTDRAAGQVSNDDVVMIRNSVFDFSGELRDVTNGEILGINTGSKATGFANSTFNENGYLLLATFENLPDPNSSDYYEGWIVKQEPFEFISTGKVEKIDGVYTDAYRSSTNLTDFNYYVLTLEPEDNNPEPSDHVLEGEMEKVITN